MGVKDFFRKIGRGVGKFAGKVWNGVKKVGGVVGKIAKPILNVLSVLPGKVGLIGKLGSAGAGVAEKIINQIPSNEARDKLKGYVDRGREAVGKVEDRAREVSSKVAPWAKFGSSVMSGRILSN